MSVNRNVTVPDGRPLSTPPVSHVALNRKCPKRGHLALDRFRGVGATGSDLHSTEPARDLASEPSGGRRSSLPGKCRRVAGRTADEAHHPGAVSDGRSARRGNVLVL